MSKITLVKQIPDNIENRINKELTNYKAIHQINVNYNRFSLLLEHNDEIIGALNAYTAYDEIYIDELWIAIDKRSIGFGTKLLNEIDELFKDKGYNINLITNEFQSPELYKKYHFILEFIRKNIRNPKLMKYFSNIS